MNQTLHGAFVGGVLIYSPVPEVTLAVGGVNSDSHTPHTHWEPSDWRVRFVACVCAPHALRTVDRDPQSRLLGAVHVFTLWNRVTRRLRRTH